MTTPVLVAIDSDAPGTRHVSRSWSAPTRSAQGCRSTSFGRWKRHRRSTSGSGPRWSAATDRATGREQTVAADGLFLMIGARPRTDWLPPEIVRDERGFVVTGPDLVDDDSWPLDRRPLQFETSVPGVFAVGDARSGSVKRVASAVGEGSVAIQMLHQLFEADQLRPRGRSASAAEIDEALSSLIPGR